MRPQCDTLGASILTRSYGNAQHYEWDREYPTFICLRIVYRCLGTPVGPTRPFFFPHFCSSGPGNPAETWFSPLGRRQRITDVIQVSRPTRVGLHYLLGSFDSIGSYFLRAFQLTGGTKVPFAT